MKFSKNLNKVLMGVLLMSVVVQAKTNKDGEISLKVKPEFNSLQSMVALGTSASGVGVITGTAQMLDETKNPGSIKGTAGMALGGSGLLSVLFGFGGILSSFALQAEGAELPKTKEDIAHRLRESKSYSQLVSSLGKDRAEEFLGDMLSGWTPERLIEKYARGAEEKKALMALLDKAQAPKKAAATNTQKEAQGQVAGH